MGPHVDESSHVENRWKFHMWIHMWCLCPVEEDSRSVRHPSQLHRLRSLKFEMLTRTTYKSLDVSIDRSSVLSARILRRKVNQARHNATTHDSSLSKPHICVYPMPKSMRSSVGARNSMFGGLAMLMFMNGVVEGFNLDATTTARSWS